MKTAFFSWTKKETKVKQNKQPARQLSSAARNFHYFFGFSLLFGDFCRKTSGSTGQLHFQSTKLLPALLKPTKPCVMKQNSSVFVSSFRPSSLHLCSKFSIRLFSASSRLRRRRFQNRLFPRSNFEIKPRLNRYIGLISKKLYIGLEIYIGLISKFISD